MNLASDNFAAGAHNPPDNANQNPVKRNAVADSESDGFEIENQESIVSRNLEDDESYHDGRSEVKPYVQKFRGYTDDTQTEFQFGKDFKMNNYTQMNIEDYSNQTKMEIDRRDTKFEKGGIDPFAQLEEESKESDKDAHDFESQMEIGKSLMIDDDHIGNGFKP